jgi:GDP-4-dehydro-6-deoxy-D-mannose reductase
MRPSDNPVVLGDNARIRDEVGWTPGIGMEQTLRDLLTYWRNNRLDPPRGFR